MFNKKEILESANVFCALPWASLHIGTTGTLSLCCQSTGKEFSLANLIDINTLEKYDFKELNKLRRRLLKGLEIPHCQKCYNIEKNKGESLRLSFLKKENLDYFRRALGYASSKEMINDIYRQNGRWDKAPVYLDLKPSNKCNLQCRMCGPASSDMIKRKNKKALKSNWLREKNNFNKIVSLLPGVVQLKIGGGEPTITNSVHKMLHYCNEKKYAPNIKLSITTNGLSINNILAYAGRFKSMNITFSIEAIGYVYEFIRHPAKWDSVESNFLKVLRKRDINVSINTIIMLDNIYYIYHDFLPWINEKSKIKQFTVYPFIIRKPEYHSPYILPINIRKYIAVKIRQQLKKMEHINKSTKDNFLCLSHILEGPGFSEEKMAWGFKEFIRDYRN